MQFFDYKRRVKKNNVITEQIIKCKIKGLRSDGLKEYLERKKRENINPGDGTTLVKISGCEYKITEERLNDVLSHWGVISSRIREEVFVDPHDKDGSNRTGIYTVRMYKHAIQLFKIYNATEYTMDWSILNFNQIFTSRQSSFMMLKSNEKKVGINILANRLSIVNGKIPFEWLNCSLPTFKMHCKKLFLK